MKLGLEGQTIDAISLDFAVTIRTNAAAVLRIGTGLVIHGPGGSMATVQADDVGPTSSSLVGILHRTITSAEVDDDGTFRLTLEPELHVEVRPDDDYEAWTYNGADGQKLVALPGGGLAVWDG